MAATPATSSPWHRWGATTTACPVVSSGNWAAVGAYEPGSVGKIITMAGALEDGVVTPTTTRRAMGSTTARTTPTTASSTTRTRTTRSRSRSRDILVESSNIGTINVGRDAGYAAAVPLPHGFGLGEPTALGFPRRVAGHPQAVGAVGGYRALHDRLRPGSGVDADPARRRGQRDRQRRRLCRATPGDRYGRRRWRDHRRRPVGDATTSSARRPRPRCSDDARRRVRRHRRRGPGRRDCSVAGKTGPRTRRATTAPTSTRTASTSTTRASSASSRPRIRR